MSLYIEVALPVPTDRLFTYAVSEEDINGDAVGRRVLVNFGKRTLTGIIVGTLDESKLDKEFKIKEVIEVLDAFPIFNSTLMNLTKWIAEYYFCTWGEALKAALPQGMSPQSVIKADIIRYPEDDELEIMKKRAPKRYALLKLLREHLAPVSVGFLETKLDCDSVAAQITALEQLGIIQTTRLVDKDLKPRYLKGALLNPEILENKEDLRKIFDELDAKAPKQALALSQIYTAYAKDSSALIIADIQPKEDGWASVVKSLEKKGLVEIIDVEIDRNRRNTNEISLANRDESALTLTYEQEKCAESINEAIETGVFSAFLLRGITGGGKTLVYLNAIKKCLSLGKNVLMLVPEIALTPQLIDRFAKVFPDEVTVFHSKMSQGERYDSWRSALSGSAKIILGARSGLFAPISNVGLIVVDEEHEPSYKQDSPAPRYNGRDCAVVRAKLENAVVVLGSATPSLESMQNAVEGRYKLLEITQRADGAVLPDIKLVDTSSKNKAVKMRGAFSAELIDEIKKRLAKKEGVILFRNKRGYSALLECPDCNHIPECKNCSVKLTYHKSVHQLRCHYCGYTVRAFFRCPECGHPKLKEMGSGTQRIEDELNEILIEEGFQAKITRMDLDTTSKKGSHRAILQSFANGETDILIGTQMVAKGLDFDRVTLVGVVNADQQLFLPDFRASERTFQLLSQVSGRAGRSGAQKGEVIIQSAHIENETVIAARDHDYKEFFNSEIINRKAAFYPPFSRFCKIELSGEDPVKVNEAATIFAKSIPTHQALIVLGPSDPAVAKIRNMYRKLVIIKSLKEIDKSGLLLRKALQIAMDTYKSKSSDSGIKIVVDPDSYSGM